MAHRYYNIPTCLKVRGLCFEALEMKIKMVKWEWDNKLKQ